MRGRCNSQQNPLTPWPNDPVSDSPHEVMYLRDEDTGALWSATALPIRVAGANYVTMHGKGWSRFSHTRTASTLELLQCVPTADPIKLSRLRLRNHSARARRLSITGYVEWALGANGSTPAPFVVTARMRATGALFARNPWRADFGERVAFFDLAGVQQLDERRSRASSSARSAASTQPAALRRRRAAAGRVGAGLDPCGALQTRIELAAAHAGRPRVHARRRRRRSGGAGADRRNTARPTSTRCWPRSPTQWNGCSTPCRCSTPDRAMDILLNDWLLYQVAGLPRCGRAPRTTRPAAPTASAISCRT